MNFLLSATVCVETRSYVRSKYTKMIKLVKFRKFAAENKKRDICILKMYNTDLLT